MTRTGKAFWQGSGKEGKGNLSTQSQILNKANYTWSSRFEQAAGTNPEELITAAHAGCFTLKLSFVLGEAGFTADAIETTAAVTIEAGTITTSKLTVNAKVPGISKEKFEECAKNAKENCPVSKVLKAEITLEASLTEKAFA